MWGGCGVAARNGYKLERKERRLDFSGLAGFRANRSHLNIKKGLRREGDGTLVLLNLVYLPPGFDQVQPKLAQLRFIKSVLVARATGTTPKPASMSGLLSPLFLSMGTVGAPLKAAALVRLFSHELFGFNVRRSVAFPFALTFHFTDLAASAWPPIGPLVSCRYPPES